MNNLQVIEYQNKRVLTTQQLAIVYETEANNIKNNFARNKDRFIAGQDYYLLQGVDLKEFKNQVIISDLVDKHTTSLYLWTERGSNRHCKLVGTDKAWEQFDVLEETYFNFRNESVKPLSQLEVLVQSAQALLEHDKAIKQLASTQQEQGEQLARLIDIQSYKAEIIKELPPVNPLTQRAQLNQIIRGYAERNNIEYSKVWCQTYEQFLSRYSINLKTRAKNRNQSVLDFAQFNGFLADLLALSIELFC